MKIGPAILLVLAVAACGIGGGGEARELDIEAVIRGDLIVTSSSTGVLEPVLEVEVTSKASGEILRIHVDVGDEI
ncbi:MAG: efflux RND transporter periplasmic adaptor subunit, partial [Gemmatimonadota bacterium]|nr:efflux RND transporter periplasmic adaptor subunit [Gemmatimonadota bacterium]